MGKLEHLELLNMADNKLEDVKALAPLTNLVTINLDRNCLTTLEGLNFTELKRLRVLSGSDNQLTELATSVGELSMLESLNLERNKLEDVPMELGNLIKKMQVMKLDENPIKDAKLRKNIKKATEGARELKEVLKFMSKNAKKSGGKKGKGGKKKKGKK